MSLADQLWCPTSVQVTVLQARGLRIKGKSGTNDAYAVMQMGKDKYQTSVVEKSVAPVWKEEASFDLPPLHQGGTERSTLHVHVLHRALVGPDKLLGQAVIHLLQLSEDKSRDKTEWFKLLDKTGKADKDRGEVLLDIQFMRNNMTASMCDLSAAGKSRSRLGKFKDKVRGKKKESDSASNMVPSLTQVLTDSEDEAIGDGEVAVSKEGKNKKLKSFFSPKSNLQRNMSQSMSVLPAKNSSLSSSQSSGLNVDSSEGKKKFKFMIHKRSGSSDNKNSGHQKQVPVEQSNLCINGSHVYCEELQPRASRIGSNLSLTSSGHGSMEDAPENSPSSVDSLRAGTQYTAWTEEEEDIAEEDDENESRRMEDERMEEERRRKEEKELEKQAEEERRQVEEEERRAKEERVQREEEDRLEREEEKGRQEEEERMRREEEKRRQDQEERMRREEEKRRQEEEERMRREEERRRQEEEERMRREEEKRRQEEEERMRREEEKRRQDQEERMRREEEKRRQEEEERMRREEERRRQEEEERMRREEERRRQEEEERMRREEEKKRQEEEDRMKKEEEKRRQEEEERMRREEEKRRKEEEERMRREEEKRKKEEEKRMKREEERRRQEEEEEERMRREEERKRQGGEAERVRRAEEEKRKEKQRRQEEEKASEALRVAEVKRRREEEEEILRKQEEEHEKKRKQEQQEKRKREEEEERERLMEEERKRTEAEEKYRKEEEEEKIRVAEEFRRKEEEEEKVRQEKLKEKRRLEKEERQRAEQHKMKLEEERIRKQEEQRRHEEEERIRKEKQERMEEERRRQEEEEEKARKKKEEMERLAETRRREEQEKKRIEEEEKVRREEEEKIKREERAEKERKEEEAKRLEEKLKREAEEQEKKENKMRTAGSKSTVSYPAEVISTNPFDDNCPCNPSESPYGPLSSSTGTQQRCQRGVLSVGSKTVSTDEKDLIGSQREKRPAPQPPGRNQTKTVSQKEQDLSMQQTHINKQNKDAKTVGVHPRRSVQMIAPQSRSPADTTKATAAKHGKHPAPSRPHPQQTSSEPKTCASSDRDDYSYNPFEDDEDELPDDASESYTTGPIQWPPAASASEDSASQTKIKSSKTAHAPLPPAVKNDASMSTYIAEAGSVSDDVNVADKPVHFQESALKDSQLNIMEARVKKEAPPVASHRLQPVKPLNPLEPQSVSGDLAGALDKTKVNDTGVKGPYSQLTREELITLVLKQEKQLSERDKKISELEQYIDNLLVRVIEEQPSILMSLNSLKKAA